EDHLLSRHAGQSAIREGLTSRTPSVRPSVVVDAEAEHGVPGEAHGSPLTGSEPHRLHDAAGLVWRERGRHRTLPRPPLDEVDAPVGRERVADRRSTGRAGLVGALRLMLRHLTTV